MGLDVSDAIALAKDLLQTSNDYRQHDPGLASAFSERAFEICNDLGIDHSLIGAAGEQASPVDDAPVSETSPSPAVSLSADPTDVSSMPITGRVDDRANMSDDDVSTEALVIDDDELEETSLQLRNLLQQQARVMQTMQEPEPVVIQKPKRSAFRLFGRSADQRLGALQSA